MAIWTHSISEGAMRKGAWSDPQERGRMIVDVTFTNGTDVFVVNFKYSDPNSLAKIINDWIVQNQAIEDAPLVSGSVDLSAFGPKPPPAPPTDEEIAARAYSQALSKLTEIKRLQSLDATLVDQKEVDAAVAAIKVAKAAAASDIAQAADIPV